MNIFGTDTVLEGKATLDDLSFIVKFIATIWRDAVYQNEFDDEETSFSPDVAVSKRTTGVFIYRDRAMVTAWNALGATKETVEGMIQVMFSDNSVTWVSDGAAAIDIVQRTKAALIEHRIIREASSVTDREESS